MVNKATIIDGDAGTWDEELCQRAEENMNDKKVVKWV